MDYEKQYQQLIAKHGHADKPDDDQYYERHHVLPKSLGGSNDDENLVYLSGKAHFIAHYLLFKVHGVGPMSTAFWAMSVMDQTSGKRHVPNGRSFEVAREAHAKARAKMSGENHPFYGRTHSDKAKAKLAKAMAGENHHSAKRANVYVSKTNELITEGVVLKVWCRENEYDQSSLSATTRADLTKPSSSSNRHQHKGIYARYVQTDL